MIGSAQVIFCYAPDTQFLIAQGNQIAYDGVMKITCMFFHMFQGALIKRQSLRHKTICNLPFCLNGEVKMSKVAERVIPAAFQPFLILIEGLCQFPSYLRFRLIFLRR